MPYPNKAEIVSMLKERRHIDIVNEYLIVGLPFVFREKEELYASLRTTLAMQFRTPIEDVSMIGSARIGFSLDPDKFGAPFSSASDIDTIVVNAELFDTAWFELCAVGRRRFSLHPNVQRAFEMHRTNNVFFGYMDPSRLPGIVALSTHWFHTFRQLGRIRGLTDFDIHGRLYRTWNHVRAHQLYSLESIATKLRLL